MTKVENLCDFCTRVELEECALRSIRPSVSAYPALEAELADQCSFSPEGQFQFEDPLADNLAISNEAGDTTLTLREFLANSMLHKSYWNAFVSAVKIRVADPKFPQPVYTLIEEREIVEGRETPKYSVGVSLPPQIAAIRNGVLANENGDSVNSQVGSELFDILYLRIDSLLRSEPNSITIK